MNHYLWVSLSLCCAGNKDLGWSDKNKKRWWLLDVPCQKCQRHVTFKLGIICANYGRVRGLYQARKGAFFAECYTAHYLDTFETAVPRDFNRASLAEVEDEVCFWKVRPWDQPSVHCFSTCLLPKSKHTREAIGEGWCTRGCIQMLLHASVTGCFLVTLNSYRSRLC